MRILKLSIFLGIIFLLVLVYFNLYLNIPYLKWIVIGIFGVFLIFNLFFLHSLPAEIYESSIIEDTRENLSSISSRIRKEIEKLITHTVKHDNSLAQHESILKKVKKLEEVKMIASTLLVELEKMRQTNNALQRRLEEANQKISHQQEILDNLKKEVIKDPLTGILNRRGFQSFHQKIYHQFIKRGDSYALLLIDIDHFKHINDTYGHDTGDYILKEFSNLLNSIIPREWILARYGGEEFVIIAPTSNKREVLKIAEKIRKKSSSIAFKYNKREINITISIGISFSKAQDTKESIFKRADNALYLAKRSGRNCIKTENDIE